MHSLLAQNKKPSLIGKFTHPLPSQHLEYGSTKFKSVGYNSFIPSTPRIFVIPKVVNHIKKGETLLCILSPLITTPKSEELTNET
jgi:hypothetical protein